MTCFFFTLSDWTQCISLHKVLMRHFCAVLNISNRKYVFARRLKEQAIFSSYIFHPDTLCFIAILSNSQMTPRKAMRLLSMVIMKHLSNIWKIRICSFNEALTLTLMVPSSSISFLLLTLERKKKLYSNALNAFFNALHWFQNWLKLLRQFEYNMHISN